MWRINSICLRPIFAAVCLQIVSHNGWQRADAEDGGATVGTQRPARDASSHKNASSERILVLQNSKVLKGVIRQSSTGYIVNMPGGHLVLPFDQVRFEAEDLEDAYRQQREALPDQTASHIELARWCLANALPDHARKELRAALRCDPDSSVAKNMLQRINDQLLTTKEVPAVVQRDGQFSLLGELKPGIAPDALGGLPREAASEFVTKVQPLLVNRCATAGCHGPGSGNTFELQRAKVGKGAPKMYSERNLAAVLERVDRERPLGSPMLVKLRGEPKAFGTRQSHGGLSQEQLRMLRSWIETISKKPEELAKPTVETATDDTEETANGQPSLGDRGRDSQSGDPNSRAADQVESGDNLFQRLLRELRSPDAAPEGVNRSTSGE